MTEMALTLSGPEKLLATIGQRRMVLLPLEDYEALLERLEDLEDVLASSHALAEYRAGAGRDFTAYLSERQQRYDVQDQDSQPAG